MCVEKFEARDIIVLEVTARLVEFVAMDLVDVLLKILVLEVDVPLEVEGNIRLEPPLAIVVRVTCRVMVVSG